MPAFSSRCGRRALFWARQLVVLAVLLSPFAFCALQVGAQELSTAPPSGRPGELFDRVITNQKQSETTLDRYERIQRTETRKAGADPRPTGTKVLRLFPAGPAIDKIPLSPDGKPISTQSCRTELEKLEKYLVWVMQDGPGQKEAYAKAQRRRKERFDLIEATHQAFLFTFVGRELRADRILLRYTMEPNPKYRPTSRNTTLFTKVHGVIWVDEQSSQLAKVEGTVMDDISLSLFLAKVYKGSHFMQERYEIAPGLWEPTFEQYDFDGRKFLMPFSIHERTFYSNYKLIGPPTAAIEAVRAKLSKLRAEAPAH
ncbi:MAG TPA: hypothetical protein VEI54_00880 [Candidatus Limnocylindrales bacterium]|nr:hypothetical protein [Candidatus Limnocylindrales bacterium]